jgi:hypothetical protein
LAMTRKSLKFVPFFLDPFGLCPRIISQSAWLWA